MNNEKEKIIFELVEGKHFTYPKLVEHLNKKYGSKLVSMGKRKTTFTLNDVHQYTLSHMGHIPLYVNGNNTLKEIYIPEIGLKIVELTWI